MDNEVFAVETAPVVGIVLDAVIFSVFVPIVAGIIGLVAVVNAMDGKSRLGAAV